MKQPTYEQYMESQKKKPLFPIGYKVWCIVDGDISYTSIDGIKIDSKGTHYDVGIDCDKEAFEVFETSKELIEYITRTIENIIDETEGAR